MKYMVFVELVYPCASTSILSKNNADVIRWSWPVHKLPSHTCANNVHRWGHVPSDTEGASIYIMGIYKIYF
jgi:hypothetical protein